MLENETCIHEYSDDNFLHAPSLQALQCMLDICEEYAYGRPDTTRDMIPGDVP